jgi:hypothetical protein
MRRVALRVLPALTFAAVSSVAPVASVNSAAIPPAARFASLRFQSTKSGVNYNLLPPAFDLPRWNDDDASKGYCLRVSYTEERVVLTYIKQAPQSTDPNAEENKRRHGERVVSVYLPNVYIARFLAVLEGTIPKCEIASRQTTGTFCAGSEPNAFTLSCKSAINGHDNFEWGIELDPAAALMLQRFLTQSLHFNNGFQK